MPYNSIRKKYVRGYTDSFNFFWRNTVLPGDEWVPRDTASSTERGTWGRITVCDTVYDKE